MNKKILTILILLLISNVSNAESEIPKFVKQQSTPIFGKKIRSRFNQIGQDEKLNAWIYFTDKNIFTEKEYHSALNKAKVRNEIVDFKDIDVNQAYINEITDSGIRLRTKSKWLNAISVRATKIQFEQISELPFISRIELVLSGKRKSISPKNQLGKPYKNPKTNYGSSYAQLEQINVIWAHENGYKGQGIIVLMLDSGYFTDHEAIPNSQIIAEWDFINNDGITQNESGDPAGQHDHGTATLTTLGGSKEGELYGPAYEASFLLAKTEDTSQEVPIEEDWYVAGLEWGENLGADVASSSLGYIDWYNFSDLDGNTAVTTIAVDIAVANGVVCVTAAGNEGTSGIIAPADAFGVITVGAVDNTGNLAYFSSHGPTADGRIKPEVLAQGVNTHCAGTSSSSSYTEADGTSLSTPLVGGAAAVLLSANPTWTPGMVREALMMTADNFNNPNNQYGWGIIDIMAAINYEFLPIKLNLTNILIDDSNGNNNGKADPGETFDMQITLINRGTDPAININGILTTDDNYLNIQQYQSSFPAIESWETCTSNSDFTIKAATGTPEGHKAQLRLSLSASGGYSKIIDFELIIGTPPILIIDLDQNHNSGPVIFELSDSLGRSAEIITEIPTGDILNYKGIFLCLGIYPDNTKLNESNVSNLTEFLDNGGNLYMEGGETWGFDSPTSLHTYFNINNTSDGSNDLSNISSVVGTFTDSMYFEYAGDNQYIDRFSPGNDQDYAILENEDPQYTCTVANEAENYRTIASSCEFGGLVDDAGLSTKYQYLNRIFNFFEIEENTLLLGDVNGDGEVVITDIIQMIRFILELEIPTEIEFLAADINQDSNIDILDIIRLKNIILNIE